MVQINFLLIVVCIVSWNDEFFAIDVQKIVANIFKCERQQVFLTSYFLHS